MITRSVPSNTESPCLTLISEIFPSLCALILFSIFIASRIITVCPFFTVSPSFTLMSRITPGSGDFTPSFFPVSSTNWSLYNRGTVICFRSGGRTGYRFGSDSGFYGFVKLYFVRSTVYFNVYDILFRIVYCNIVEISVILYLYCFIASIY